MIETHFNAAKQIFADRDRIGQVLGNLITNAIKYSPGADRIVVTSKSDEKNITICVQDFGIGITPEMQKRIFDRFFRLYEKKITVPGLGLGLYIAAELVKRHGGTINVESIPGEGSVFCFTIPRNYSFVAQ